VIDPAAATGKVTGVIGAGNGASLDATQAMIDALADCWDDCEAALARDPARSNPYRQLDAAQYGMIERDEIATVPADDPRGVWIVWRSQGSPQDGFTTIFPQHAEINALRQVNADGYGHAEFIPFGADAGH
jgi:hypothetical protein